MLNLDTKCLRQSLIQVLHWEFLIVILGMFLINYFLEWLNSALRAINLNEFTAVSSGNAIYYGVLIPFFVFWVQ